MQTQQCNGQAVFLIWINVSLKFCLQRFLGPLGVYFSVHVAPHSDRLAQGAAKAKTIDRLDELRHSRRQQKNGRNIHGNTARTQNSWPIRGRGHIKRVAQARAQIALGRNGRRSRAAPEEVKARADASPEDSVVATPTETD
jgi:hypothetical protein